MGSLEALPRLEAVSRQYFHCLGLGLGLTLIVLVLVLPILSWSCASRPIQFKTPVEKREQPTDLSENQLAKYLTMINRVDSRPRWAFTRSHNWVGLHYQNAVQGRMALLMTLSCFINVRQKTEARYSYMLSVCPSVVCHTLILCRNGSTYRQTVFTAW